MNLSLLQQSYFPRRTASFRSPTTPGADSIADSPPKPSSYSHLFLLMIHFLCCLVSLILGFRFSRVVFFLLYSSSSSSFSPTTTTLLTSTTTTTTTLTTTTTTTILTHTLPLPLLSNDTATSSRVAVGRHGIRIRPWPHPDAQETMRAHEIIDRVQREQRMLYGAKNPRPLIVVTPTYVRTFQTLYLTSLTHSLMLLPYDLTWVVVESGGASKETASLLEKSQLNFIHVPFQESPRMPADWTERSRIESRMRLHALRVIRERQMDGIVVFADESNIHSLEVFDEMQKVEWMGAVSVGILTRPGDSPDELKIQGPACDSAGKLVGWRTFDSSSQTKLEWAGFVFNARLLWGDGEGRPEWMRDLDDVGVNGEEIESPLALVKDAGYVEALGDCGKKVLLWWVRAEARAESKFPARWVIEPPLKATVSANRNQLRPDAIPELQFENMNISD